VERFIALIEEVHRRDAENAENQIHKSPKWKDLRIPPYTLP